MTSLIKTFIIYARIDEIYKNQLLRHLRPLRSVSVWHDGNILPGEEWNSKIKNELKSSELVLFLVSADSLYSEYIQSEELQTALKMLNQGQIRIIPIIIAPCAWKHDPIIRELQSLPKFKGEGVKPVRSWDDIDEAWASVVDHIGDLIEKSYKHKEKDNAKQNDEPPKLNSQEDKAKNGSIRIKTSITLEQILLGVSKKIKYNRLIRCAKCDGSGTFYNNKCHSCNGKGSVSIDEVIEIEIPVGATKEIQLSMLKKGNYVSSDNNYGDLFITIEELPHEIFERGGLNIIHELKVSIPEAIIGGTVICPTLDGVAKIKIPPGTQPGKIFRLKGKGLPKINSAEVGDLLVIISVWIPEKVTNEEQSVVEKMSNLPNFIPPTDNKGSKGFFTTLLTFFDK